MKLSTKAKAAAERRGGRLGEALKKIERLERENDDLRASLGASLEREEIARDQLQEAQLALANCAADGFVERQRGLTVLAGGIAHDFNNLLAVIIGNADIGLHEELSPRARACLDGISEAAETATKQTRQLLTYAGSASIGTDLIDLDEFVSGIADQMGAALSKNVEFIIDLSDLPITIEGSRAQLEQVVMNLLENASDAIGDDPGSIRVATRVARPRLDEPLSLEGHHRLTASRYACVEVSDSGQGMTSEVRSRLFDPFFSTKGSGHGLGMATSLGILRGHGGDIGVNSLPGRGTTFRVYLPLRPATPEMTPPLENAAPPDPVGLILVVDDEPHLRRLARKLLEKQGHRVLDAADGRECVEIFAQHADEIDLVLLDLSMPEQSGDEAFAQMRSLRPDVKVILLSGHQKSDLPTALDSSELHGFLRKPYDVTQLMDEVVRALAAEPKPA